MIQEDKNEIVQIAVAEHLMDVIFEKPIYTQNTPEEQLLNYQKNFGIKVQSVALPKKHELFSLKTESQVINWMQNKINNIYTAYHKIESKFDADYERVHWSNNKMQNKRFFETKKLYNV